MIRLLKYNLILLIIFNVSAQSNLKVKNNNSKKVLARLLIAKNKKNKKQKKQSKILRAFVFRRFGNNPASTPARIPIASALRRFGS